MKINTKTVPATKTVQSVAFTPEEARLIFHVLGKLTEDRLTAMLTGCEGYETPQKIADAWRLSDVMYDGLADAFGY